MTKTLIAVSVAATMISLPAAPRAPKLPSVPSNAPHVHAHSGPEDMIPFSSNGCSGFREARFFSCCYVHDLAYWAGGTWSSRSQADRTLRQCLAEISHDWVLAYVAHALIRLKIIPGAIVGDGWGRAWRNSDRRKYAPLTPGQQKQINDEKRRVCQGLIHDPKTGRYRVDQTREIRLNQARQVCGGDPPAPAGSGSPLATSR